MSLQETIKRRNKENSVDVVMEMKDGAVKKKMRVNVCVGKKIHKNGF